MGSPAPNVDVQFEASVNGYETSISTEKHNWRSFGCLTRRELVDTIHTYVKGTEDSRTTVRIYSRGLENTCHVLSRRTVARIVAGTLSAEALCIGEIPSFLERQLRNAVSRLVPTRAIPGTANFIECIFCGRGMVLSKCRTCEREVRIIVDKFRGPCVDLVETLDLNPEVDRLFVNQPWNPTPPWLSRVDLFQMLKES